MIQMIQTDRARGQLADHVIGVGPIWQGPHTNIASGAFATADVCDADEADEKRLVTELGNALHTMCLHRVEVARIRANNSTGVKAIESDGARYQYGRRGLVEFDVPKSSVLAAHEQAYTRLQEKIIVQLLNDIVLLAEKPL